MAERTSRWAVGVCGCAAALLLARPVAAQAAPEKADAPVRADQAAAEEPTKTAPRRAAADAGGDVPTASADEGASEQPLEQTAAAAPSGPSREAVLEQAVRDAEQDEPSVLLPWLVTGLGVASLVTGVVMGSTRVAGCSGSCTTSSVASWFVLGGAALTSTGAMLVILITRDQAEARHRIERARQELERDRVDHGQRATVRPNVTLRASF